uniref:RxLR effector candidate protein n=1 Tax=Peronospora matthiolae TaxID=2874970 RepID=A0AAV1TQT1_9STRA
MRTALVFSLAAAAFVGSASSSTLHSASVVTSQEDESAKTRVLRSGATEADRLLDLPVIVDILKTKTKKLIDKFLRALRLEKGESFVVRLARDAANHRGSNPFMTLRFKSRFDRACLTKARRKSILWGLLKHFDDVELARMLEAARQNKEYEVMAKALQEALIEKWVTDESIHIDDVFVKLELNTGLEKALTSPDLVLFNRYINIRNRYRTNEKDRTTLLRYLVKVYTVNAVVRQIQNLKDANPTVRKLRNRLFEEWCMEDIDLKQVRGMLEFKLSKWADDPAASILRDFSDYRRDSKRIESVEFKLD